MRKVTDLDGKDVIRCISSATAILRGFLTDLEAGLLGDFSNKIRAEAFDNFLDHAEIYRQDGKEMEAGVIAAVVFEDTIRRIYRDKINTDDKDKQLDHLINALAARSIITGQQAK